MAKNLTVALHEVLTPSWLPMLCLAVGFGATLAIMLFIATGVGNFFFEGVVICSLTAIMCGGMASMVVSSHQNRVKAVQKKQLRQQLLLKEQQRLQQKKLQPQRAE
jgi:hypothetical protein